MKTTWSQDRDDQLAYIAASERGIRMNDYKFWHGREGRRFHVELFPEESEEETVGRYRATRFKGFADRFRIAPNQEDHVRLREVLEELGRVLGPDGLRTFLASCEAEGLDGAARTRLSRTRARLRHLLQEDGQL